MNHYEIHRAPQTPVAVERLLAAIATKRDYDAIDRHGRDWQREALIDRAAAAVRQAQADDEVASWQLAPPSIDPREECRMFFAGRQHAGDLG